MTRYVMRLEPIASTPVDDIVDLVAPRIRSYAVGSYCECDSTTDSTSGMSRSG